MRGKAPQNVFLRADLAHVQPVGVDVVDAAETQPLSISSLSFRTAGWYCRMWPTIRMRRCARPGEHQFRAFHAFSASGFSTKTSLPASNCLPRHLKVQCSGRGQHNRLHVRVREDFGVIALQKHELRILLANLLPRGDCRRKPCAARPARRNCAPGFCPRLRCPPLRPSATPCPNFHAH